MEEAGGSNYFLVQYWKIEKYKMLLKTELIHDKKELTKNQTKNNWSVWKPHAGLEEQKPIFSHIKPVHVLIVLLTNKISMEKRNSKPTSWRLRDLLRR